MSMNNCPSCPHKTGDTTIILRAADSYGTFRYLQATYPILPFFPPETRSDLLFTEFLLPAECCGSGCVARGQSHYEQRHSASLITRSVCRLSDALNESHGELPTNTPQFQLVWHTMGSPRISAIRNRACMVILESAR